MKVVHCGPVDAARWDAFVARTPGASFYHRFGWKVINEEMLDHRTAYLAAVDEAREIRGIFPIVQVKSALFGNLACSMPFVNYGGPVAETPEVEQAADGGSGTRLRRLEGRLPRDPQHAAISATRCRCPSTRSA